MSEGERVHVVCGAGPLGTALAKQLTNNGHVVRLVSRSGRPAPIDTIEVVAADLTDPTSADLACADAEVVYNCTNVAYDRWPKDLPPLAYGVLEAAARANASLVIADNVYAYGPVIVPMTEDLPLVATTRKGRVRAQLAEEALHAHAEGRLPVCICRASDFFGPGAVDSVLGVRVFGACVAGKRATLLGNLDQPHTYTYIEDFARAMATLGSHPDAFGRSWHAPSPQTVTTRQLVTMAYELRGTPAAMTSIGWVMLEALGLIFPMMHEVGEMMYQFERPFVVDSTAYETAFGEHATPLREALTTTTQWFDARAAAAKRTS